MAEAALGAPGVLGNRAGLGQLVRFLLVGGSNTLITLVLFVLLQNWLSASAAYTVVFALGLAYTTAMTANVVFGSRLTWRTGGAFVGWYLLVYGVGLLSIQLLHTWADPSPTVTAVLTVVVTAPLNFLGGRLLFRQPAA
ncbi:GtrA family protein [Modestobacter versicolor]|uniref:GtrA family protein n=1 Tax=Modestobacter versicolor TaxID=429133 RepID=UPI0034DF4F3C